MHEELLLNCFIDDDIDNTADNQEITKLIYQYYYVALKQVVPTREFKFIILYNKRINHLAAKGVTSS